jgi:hypothetical protein
VKHGDILRSDVHWRASLLQRMSEDDMEASVATSVENTRADEAPSLPTIVPPPAGKLTASQLW